MTFKYSMLKHRIIMTVALVMLFSFSACSNNGDNLTGSNTLNLNTADIALSLNMTNAPSSVVKVKASLSRTGDTTRTLELVIGNNTASGTFRSIPEGTWQLKVDALDSANNVLYSGQTSVDVFNGQVTNVNLVLTPQGGIVNLSVTWGNSGAPVIETFASGFDRPAGLAFDVQGNLYVVSLNPGSVNKVTPNGTNTLFATGLYHGASGNAVSSNGYVYTVYYADNTLKRVPSAGGVMETFAYGFDNPADVELNIDGFFYVSSADDGTVKKVSQNGQVTLFASGLSTPVGLTSDNSGNLYVAERTAGRITKISSNGTKTTIATGLSNPHSLIFDNQGALYASEASGVAGNRIYRVKNGSVNVAVSGLAQPTGLAFDNQGRLYVSEIDAGKVSRITFQ